MAQRTYTVLENNVISNGTYSIRYTMEDGSPLFVLRDVFLSIGYTPQASSYYCKKLGLGKLVKKECLLVNYATLDEAEIIFKRLHKINPDFLNFWENEVVPTTDINRLLNKATDTINKIQNMLDIAVEKNATLIGQNAALKAENEQLKEQLNQLMKERAAITNILGNAA